MIIPDNYKRIDEICRNRIAVISAISSNDREVLADVEQITMFAENNPDLIRFLPEKARNMVTVQRVLRKHEQELADELEGILFDVSSPVLDEPLNCFRASRLPDHEHANRYYRRLAKRKGKKK